MQFSERLAAAMAANRSHLCVGIDPVLDRIHGGNVLAWAKAIIGATADLVCCYKPNSAFFEALGPKGWEILQETIAAVPSEIPVLLDAKRGDIGSTAEAYAAAAFMVLGAGAVTVNPYLGGDSLEPFLAYRDRSIFVLCRTSNPGARDLQDLLIEEGGRSRPLYELVAERCRRWSTMGDVGLVVGATYPAEIARVRAICPDQTLLIPGVGTQGGDLGRAVRAAKGPRAPGFLINASRQVIFASTGADYASAARSAAESLRTAIEAVRNGEPASGVGGGGHDALGADRVPDR